MAVQLGMVARDSGQLGMVARDSGQLGMVVRDSGHPKGFLPWLGGTSVAYGSKGLRSP